MHDLDRIDAKDSEIIRSICDGFFQIKQSDALPPQWKHKFLCFAVFQERAQQVGSRRADWKAECLKADGSIEHWAAGPYKFHFNGEARLCISWGGGKERHTSVLNSCSSSNLQSCFSVSEGRCKAVAQSQYRQIPKHRAGVIT